MDTSKIREAFLNAPEKIEDVTIPDWLAPFLEEGTQLAIKDVPSDILTTLAKQAEKDPTLGDIKLSASMICEALINKATGENIFASTDRDAIAKLGATKITDLSQQIGKFFGFIPNAVAEAKKN